MNGYWIAFNKVPGIGPARLAALVETCGSVEAAWKAPIQQLQMAGLDKRSLASLLDARRTLDPQGEVERVLQENATILTWDDADYPENLRQVDAAPPVLYVRGALDPQDTWSVAVVGTRRASAYGREVAHTLSRELAAQGITIVSGLALGIDAIAHQAALDAGGRTIAVLGSGVDQLYPARNRKLAQAIMHHGAVLSEYPMGTKPEASNFPPRNRIISGLSRSVIVVEAGERSGALITATFAAEHGRDVFAVPGSILHPGSIGCNRLIRDGAFPLLGVDDVLEQLDMSRRYEEQHHEQQQMRSTIPADPMESQVLAQLTKQPTYIDDIVRTVQIPSGQVSSLLTVMELKGLVRQVSAMCYVRA